MSEVTRNEFNGLGKRVGELREDFVGNRSGNKVKIENLESMADDGRKNQVKIFEKLESLEVKVSIMWAKITAAVVVGMALIQLALRFIPVGK